MPGTFGFADWIGHNRIRSTRPRLCYRRLIGSMMVLGMLIGNWLVASPLYGLQSDAAAGESDRITAHDVAMIKTVTAAEISPDGTQVAYTLSVPRDPLQDESGPAWSHLYVVDSAGNSRLFIGGENSVGSIDWAPDGQHISFLSKRDGDNSTSLYWISVAGGEAKKLCELETSIAEYTWHPDGIQLAVIAPEPLSASSKQLKDKGFDAEIFEEQQRFSRIYIVDPNGQSDPKMLDIEGHPTEIHFDPDGSQLVVALAPTPSVDDFYMFRKLRVVAADSGEIVARIDNEGKVGPVRWSPDGSQIAFCSGEDINDPSAGRLMVVSASGGEPRQVMAEYLPNVTFIEWKDNQTIRFVTEDGCLTGYGTVDVASGEREMRINPGGPIIAGLSLDAESQLACLIAHSPNYPREVFLFDHREVPRQLTESNPHLDDKQLARQEIVEYESSNDGERIEGVLIHPLNAEQGQRYPLIVAVHGGPEASVPNGWITSYSNPGQLAAAEGFAVFYPNYRGSTGRGVGFAKAHQSDYGGLEFDDVVDGVDHLIEIGLVDGDKVGITGGSYGGFATAWCATKHTERFAAGVMFVGISDQISKSGTTDIPEEMYLVHARKRLWEDFQFFLERSPIYYVEQARTPLLILHGKEDTRVPPSQSMELFRNLKLLGNVPVRLVYYPGEGHGNRKSAARYDYNLRMMRWMKHYLQGPGGEKPPVELEYGFE